MPNPFTLPTMAALALAGTGLGLYLGKSAIAEINPAYFGTPYSEARFHSDLVPNRPNWDSAPPTLQNADLTLGYGTGCVNCRTYPEEYVPVHDDDVDALYADAADTPDRILDEAELEIAEIARRAELASIERYTHYPISDEERPARLARAEPPSEPAAGEASSDCSIESQCEGEPTPGI